MAKTKKYAEKIIPKRGLMIHSYSFRCPYCSTTWERGGHKEGFVKAAATRHVFGCFEALLFRAGYVVGRWDSRGQEAIPIADLDGSQPWHKRTLNGVRAMLRRRERAGLI